MPSAAERNVTPDNNLHGRYWTLRYPSRALLHIFELYYQCEYYIDYAAIEAPVLSFASTRDHVIDYDATGRVMDRMSNSVLARRVDWSRAKGRHTIISGIFNTKETEQEAVHVSLDFLAEAYGEGRFWDPTRAPGAKKI